MPIRDRVCPCGSDSPPEPQATDPTLSGAPDYRNQLPQEGSFKTHMCPLLTGMHKCIHMPWHTQAQEQVGRRLCGICRKGLTSPLAVSLLPALPLILVKSSLLLHLEKESVTAELSSGPSADVFILDEQSWWVWNSGLFLHHRDGCATSLSSSCAIEKLEAIWILILCVEIVLSLWRSLGPLSPVPDNSSGRWPGESPLGRAGEPVQDGNKSFTPTRLPSAFSALFMIPIVFSVLLEFQIFGLSPVPKLPGSSACELCPPTPSCPLLGETLHLTEPHSGLWPQFAQAGSEHAGWQPGMAHLSLVPNPGTGGTP